MRGYTNVESTSVVRRELRREVNVSFGAIYVAGEPATHKEQHGTSNVAQRCVAPTALNT
jgi:hypothetical protein